MAEQTPSPPGAPTARCTTPTVSVGQAPGFRLSDRGFSRRSGWLTAAGLTADIVSPPLIAYPACSARQEDCRRLSPPPAHDLPVDTEPPNPDRVRPTSSEGQRFLVRATAPAGPRFGWQPAQPRSPPSWGGAYKHVAAV